MIMECYTLEDERIKKKLIEGNLCFKNNILSVQQTKDNIGLDIDNFIITKSIELYKAINLLKEYKYIIDIR